MIRHLLKLVWHRKRSTALLMLEIAVSFLVVFAVVSLALRLVANWGRPLGYEWQDVWAVHIGTSLVGTRAATPEQHAAMERLLAVAGELPQVEAAAVAEVAPFSYDRMDGPVSSGDRHAHTYVGPVSDGAADVLGIRVAAGRWFGPEDDGAARPPAVIDRSLAQELFGDADPVGRTVDRGGDEVRVVGVVEDFRQFGERADADNFLFVRVPPGEVEPRWLLLRMAPGATAALEPALLARLSRVTPGWSLEVEPLAAMRDSMQRLQTAPVLVGSVLAAFLLLMVSLGLLGVLWQSLTRRTRELGLRRAVGASRAAVQRQVFLELALVGGLGVLPAVVLVLQLPLLPPFDWLGPGLLAASVAGALTIVLGMALLAGWYPSRIATRLPAAEALRWE